MITYVTLSLNTGDFQIIFRFGREFSATAKFPNWPKITAEKTFNTEWKERKERNAVKCC